MSPRQGGGRSERAKGHQRASRHLAASCGCNGQRPHGETHPNRVSCRVVVAPEEPATDPGGSGGGASHRCSRWFLANLEVMYDRSFFHHHH